MRAPSTRGLFACAVTVLLAASAQAQQNPLADYLPEPAVHDAFVVVSDASASDVDKARALREILPLRHPEGFMTYVMATRPGLVADGVEALRLDKILANSAGNGGTSAVSSALGPAVLGAAIEYGGILQESTGTTTTLRFNALGLAKLAVGAAQFPACPAIDPARCTPATRALRRLSGTVSFEPTSTPTADTTTPAVPTSAQLLGNDFRVTSWGVRAELTDAKRLDDPAYVIAWAEQMKKLRGNVAPAALTGAVSALLGGTETAIYDAWSTTAATSLRAAPTEPEFRQRLVALLDTLIDRYAEADPAFGGRVRAAARAYSGYFQVRDAMVMAAMVEQAGVEFTHHSPLAQPATSNVRFIYSRRPTKANVLLTFNAAATWYDSKPVVGGRFRDVQIAGQIDRRLSDVAGLGPAVFTMAAYYQYMKADAVVDPTLAAALPGLVLADGAATVLNTKGHIYVGQAKLSIPLGEAVKVPLSVTVSNRRELVPEASTVFRGQVGLAIDLDPLLK